MLEVASVRLHQDERYRQKLVHLRTSCKDQVHGVLAKLGEVIASLLAGDRGYQVIQQLPGIGPVLAAVITAEIGDVTRFKNAGQLCSWAGLTPRHRESDTTPGQNHLDTAPLLQG
jgi:transposase